MRELSSKKALKISVKPLPNNLKFFAFANIGPLCFHYQVMGRPSVGFPWHPFNNNNNNNNNKFIQEAISQLVSRTAL